MPKSRGRKRKNSGLSKQQRKLVARQQDRNSLDTQRFEQLLDQLDALEAGYLAEQDKEN